MASRQPFPPNSRHKASIIFLAITISASVIILCIILYLLYYLWYSLVHRSRTSPFDSTTPLNKLQRFSYGELRKATNSFSESNSIGKGGSGTVFRGILKDGKLVAVKLLDSNSLQCEHEFQNELKILGALKSFSPVVCLLGFCVEKGKRLVVYEYMPNKSLQESLFIESNSGSDNNNLCLNWGRRFSIILDVAKALAFLHLECDPPVIHGDVKPSNVLLDSENRAKLSDFGLSRMKVEDEFGIDLFSQDLGKSQELWKSQELSENSNAGGLGGGNETPAFGTPANDEVDFSLALQASSSSKTSCKIHHNEMGLANNSLNFNSSFGIGSDNKGGKLKGKELSIEENGGEDWNKFVSNDHDLCGIDHVREFNVNDALVGDDSNIEYSGAKQWGKDWWWRQDGSGELCSKDYVNEWIGSQIYPSASPVWEEEMRRSVDISNLDNSGMRDKFEEVIKNPVQEHGVDCINTVLEKDELKGLEVCQSVRAKKHRKMHEMWKEEHMDELRKKRHNAKNIQVWSKWFKAPHFGLGKSFQIRRIKFGHENHNLDNENIEFSFRKGWRKNNSSSAASGDLFSRELSSTTSMRGTLCYVAPEYGGSCGYLMEKADIYSLGVLILVIVSGRRPLHVLSSPIKLEKANLISWCRHLARAGNVLELVDEKLKHDYDKEQASLCINLALSCLQRMPELRPDIRDIVKILDGDMELLQLPFGFSPPPSKFSSQSRRQTHDQCC